MSDDLSDTQQRPHRRKREGGSTPLPRVHSGRKPRAEDGAPPKRKVKGGRDKGVPGERREADDSDAVAGRWPVAGEVPQERRALRRAVPAVSPGERKDATKNPPGVPTDLTQSVSNALAKAYTGEWWRTVAWQPDRQYWCVPSRSALGEFYIVTRRGSDRSGKWWDIFRCNCPTEGIGRRICWHKAAVFIRLKQTHQLREGEGNT